VPTLTIHPLADQTAHTALPAANTHKPPNRHELPADRCTVENPISASAWVMSVVESQRKVVLRHSNWIAEINLLLRERMLTLVLALENGLPMRRYGDEIRFRRRGSLWVVVDGPERGRWYDHETRGHWYNPLGLVAHLRGTGVREALSWASAWLDLPTSSTIAQSNAPVSLPRPAEPDRDRRWSNCTARTLWSEAVPASGTLVEAYLRSRGLYLPDDAPLRFHPRAWRNAQNGPHGPAMVAPMTSPRGNEWVGVHLTYLRSDGSGKADGPAAKILLGRAGTIRLVPDAEVTMGLGLAEGIETSLAVMQRTRWRPVWAATSAGAIAQFPVLPGIEVLTLFADADEAGLEAARVCATHWRAAGRKTRILRPPTGDWDERTRSVQ
jgi:putative DNA primase/helicase